MKISQRIYEIIVQLCDANTLLARGLEVDVRRLTEMMAQQIRYEFGPKWGMKKDSIAFLDPEGFVWEYSWQDKNTKRPYSPPADMIHGQSFTPVFAVDHLKIAEVREVPKQSEIVGVKEGDKNERWDDGSESSGSSEV